MLNLASLQAPLLIGHRGYPHLYPENTLASFEGAVSAGVKMVEMDLTLSKDRQVVVIHDSTLDRTTNGTGPVSSQPWAELKKLDAGSWFAPQFSGEKLPRLEQVLNQFSGRVWFNLEVKPEAFEPHLPDDSLLNQLMALLTCRGLLKQVLVSSFRVEVLLTLAQLSAPPLLGLLSETPLDSVQLELIKKLKPFSYNPAANQLSPEVVARVQALGCRVFPYTVNSPTQRQQLFSWAVDGLFSDAPV